MPIWNITSNFDKVIYIDPQLQSRKDNESLAPKNAEGFNMDIWDADIIDALTEEVADEPETGLTTTQLATLVLRAIRDKESRAPWPVNFIQVQEEVLTRLTIMTTTGVVHSFRGEPLFLGLPIPEEESQLTSPTAASILQSTGLEVHRLGWINLVKE